MRVIPLRDAWDRTAYLGIARDGTAYVAAAGAASWSYRWWAAQGHWDRLITRAYVQGETYIYVAYHGCFRYDFATNQLVRVTLNGLNEGSVIGITSIAGYLIAWSADTVAWSSLTNPLDFVPSLTTGAGAGSVEGATGSIVVCAAAHAGFLVYTSGNVVASTYTGNAQFPFIFRALPNSGGLKEASHADYDSQAGQQYAYTTSGFQLFDVQKAQTVLSDLTDFIAGSELEDYSISSGVLSKVTVAGSIKKAVKFVANRYLVVSYGANSFTHAIVYDTQLKRFGKLRLNHIQCVDLIIAADSFDIPRHSIGLVRSDGLVYFAEFDAHAAASDAVMILGKYQLDRGKALQLHTVEVENIKAGTNFSMKALPSLDGKNTTTVPLPSVEEAGFLRTFNTRLSAKNFSLLMTGTFSLNSLILTFSATGRR
jgi:hypothetical protein